MAVVVREFSTYSASFIITINIYYYYYFDYYDHLPNSLALVNVILTIHQGTEPYPIAKDPLAHSISFTFPTPSLKFFMFQQCFFLQKSRPKCNPQLIKSSIHLSLTAMSAPTTTGTTSCCLIPHSFPIFLFKSWY